MRLRLVEKRIDDARARLYKVLNDDGTPCHGGSGKWDLDGGWMPRIENIEPCKRGYHLCDGGLQLVEWVGPSIWEAEWRGDRIDAGDKLVVSEARLVRKLATWNDRTARLFACDCAERVLSIFEDKYPGDSRPRTAIEVSRRFAVGDASRASLDAAGAAARDAARVAAWDAARGAADAAWGAAYAARAAPRGAAYAARAAPRDAAYAARVAAGVAARGAERKWQAERLRQYLFGEAP